MKKLCVFIKCLTFVLLFVYWGSTLIVNMPNCFIKIQNTSYNKKFEELFKQSWNFFAPPPKSNNRLYYSYYKKENQDTVLIGRYEVIEPIVKAKQKKRPFNFREEILDYSLNNAFVDFGSYMHKVSDIQRIQYPDATDSEIREKISEFVGRNLFKNSGYSGQVVYNYGVRFSKELNLYGDEYLMKFSMRRVPIKKFSKRFEKDSIVHEELLYESNPLRLDIAITNPLISER